MIRQVISQCNLYFESQYFLKDFLPVCLSQEQMAHAHKLHAAKNQGRKEILSRSMWTSVQTIPWDCHYLDIVRSLIHLHLTPEFFSGLLG